MENATMYGREKTFTLPSGYEVTIREQNGEDDDILSNPVEARSLRNISRFIAGLVVRTNMTATGVLSVDDAHAMPSLDRYCILIESRIFSIGNTMEFSHDWVDMDGRKRNVEYEVDLREEFLFDYSKAPSAEELNSKESALPFYPEPMVRELEFTTTSGKTLKFHLMNAESEQYLLSLPEDKMTKNQELIARNLQLKVGDKFEKVTNFKMFSMKDMVEIRSFVKGHDPIFQGTTTIMDPVTHQVMDVPIIGIDSFFYPREN